MPTAPVTVYNPTLTVSHSRRRELMQAALFIYVGQEIVKATLRTRDVYCHWRSLEQWEVKGNGRAVVYSGLNVLCVTVCWNRMTHKPCECFSLAVMN